MALHGGPRAPAPGAGRGWRALGAPGGWVLRHVRVPFKFVLVGAALLAPLTWLTGAYVATQRAQISFSRLERSGVELFRPLAVLYVAAVEARDASADGVPGPAVVQALREADGLEHDQLDTAGPWSEVRASVQAALDAAPGRDAEAAWSAALDTMRRHIALVGDRSNLTLDPDIDTYYLMDAVQFRLPALADALGAMSTESTLSAAESRPSEEALLRLAPLLATAEQQSDALEEGLAKSLAATASTEVGPAVRPTAAALQTAVDDALGSPADGAQALGAVSSHWQVLNEQLDQLLAARVSRFEDRAVTAVTVTAVATLAALYLFVVLATSVTKPVSRTIDALRSAADGEAHEPLSVAGSDEFAVLGREVNAAIERIAETRARIEHRASHDALTGLPNRQLLMQRLQALLAEFPPGGAALCFIDLDRFKTLNDTFGHAAGDEALLTVARRLRVMAGPEDTIARFAGDEFVMLVVGRSEDALHQLLTLTINVVGAPIPLPSVSAEGAEELVLTELGASVGVSVLRAGMVAEEAVQRADTAMYESKRTGGDSYTFAGNERIERRVV